MTRNRAAGIALRVFFSALLFAFTVLPLALVLWRSFRLGDAFSLDHYREVYATSLSLREWLASPNLRAFLNTLLISTATVIFASLVAIPASWLITRTDVPGHRRFRALLLVPYMIPPYLGAIAWINLCNPSVGWINRLFDDPLFDIYTITGVVWVLGLFFYTFIYLNCVSALENADPSLEEAARVSGASPLRVFLTISLPLIRPAVFSGAFLVFAATAASFGVPALVGEPGGVKVLTTRVYGYIRSGSLDGYFLAAALSAILFVIAILGSSLADWLANARRITSMSGKSARISRVRLGKWRGPAFAFLFGIFFLACILPLASVILTSFMKVIGEFHWDNFTLSKYQYVLFEQSRTGKAFVNSFILACGAASFAIVIGTAIAYLKGHPKRRTGPVIDLCVNLPYATPGTILALGIILVWARSIEIGSFEFSLMDTMWILLIAYFAKYLSFSVKALTTNVQQIDVSLEEASRVSGAGFWKTIFRIWFPLLRSGMLASWFLVFMPVFSELTMSVLLVGPDTDTVGTLLFHMQEYEDPTKASVLAVLILTFILSAYGLATFFGPRQQHEAA